MTETDIDLIVPVRVHALAVNGPMYNTNGFRRWQPDVINMIFNKKTAEPFRPSAWPWWEQGPDATGNPPFDKFGGIHLQWELPEALTSGYTDPVTGLSNFPLVPNRWLVVRYYGPVHDRKARGWVVHSDYLESEPLYDPGFVFGMDYYVIPGSEPPDYTWIGRIHDLTAGSWREPAARPGFLTAIGPGTPGFAFFDSYHCGVFSLYDDLLDLSIGGRPGDFPAVAELSYQVLGWYSDDRFDVLTRAHAGQIPGLLPPGAETLSDTLAALGWKPPAGPDGEPGLPDPGPPGTGLRDTVVRTVYAGRALGVDWSLTDQIPDPDKPDRNLVKVAIGLSTDELIGTLVRHQTGDERTAELMQALVQGTVEHLDEPVGGYLMNQETHTTWFAGPDPGRTWSIQPRPDADQSVEPTPQDLAWLARLNHDQTAYETTLNILDHDQERAWTLTWLIDLRVGYNSSEAAAVALMAQLTHILGRAGTVVWLDELPPDLAPLSGAEVVEQLDRSRNSTWIAAMSPDQRVRLMDRARPVVSPGLSAYWGVKPLDWSNEQAKDELDRLTGSIEILRRQAADLLGQIPHVPAGEDPESDEALDAAADRFAAEHGLPPSLQLRRAPAISYYTPGDPVMLLAGAGNHQPLTRDLDDPLPLRVPAHLLTEVTIDGVPHRTPATAPAPDLSGLPAFARRAAEALLCEFVPLDQAAFTSVNGTSIRALQIVVADPPANSRGPWPEFTDQWRQAWQPAFLSWHLDYVRLPYHDTDGAHWELNPETLTQQWDGMNAERGTSGDEGGLRWHAFGARAYLTPAASYVMRAQLARYLETFPDLPRKALADLRQELQASDTLVQTLDGFNTWVLQQDPNMNLLPDPETTKVTGVQVTAPIPGAESFQPLRAGQFFFRELTVIDRFGRLLSLVSADNARQFAPERAASVFPDHDASDTIASPRRFLQLAPRLLQATRLRFEAQPPITLPRVGKAAVEGWLIYNLIDRSLLVYTPDGIGLGAVRLTTTTAGAQAATWAPLPFTPYPELDSPGFAQIHPQLHALLTGLITRPDSAQAYLALIASIDNSLNAGTDTLGTDDETLVRLTGRPIAVIRASLTLELQGPPVANPSWRTAIHPGREDYLDAYFPIRLGDPIAPSEGLAGYYAGPVGRHTDYGTFLARRPATGSGSDYIRPITNGEDLALPARFALDEADPPVTRHVTLLADPHSPVYAITDILPVQALRLDPGAVHQSLADVHTAFSLAPLLAPARNQRSAASTIGVGYGTSTPAAGPVEVILDGRHDTWYESSRPPLPGDAITIDLGEQHQVTAVHALFGQPDGSGRAPAKRLQASADTVAWLELRAATATESQLRWPDSASTLQPPVSARYLRLEMTESSTEPTVVRQVEITCDPDDNHLIMPVPALWYGTFDWAEPRPPGTGDPWHAYPMAEADGLSHPDDPPLIARAGYLRQRPPVPTDSAPEATS